MDALITKIRNRYLAEYSDRDLMNPRLALELETKLRMVDAMYQMIASGKTYGKD